MFRLLLALLALISCSAINQAKCNQQKSNSILLAVATSYLAEDGLAEEPFTLLAPTDGAWDLAELGSEDLRDVIARHVIVGNNAIFSGGSKQLRALAGNTITVERAQKGFKVNGAKVKKFGATIAQSKGIVHVIEGVLAGDPSVVETAVQTPKLSTLVELLSSPGYGPVLNLLSSDGPFTVFAPSNAAFARAGIDSSNVAAVTEVLEYHVLLGLVGTADLSPSQFVNTVRGSEVLITKKAGKVSLNGGSRVVNGDIQTRNGIVHIIDKVLTPPPNPPVNIKSIVQTAASTDSLATLLVVLSAPGYEPLLNLLSTDGPFTLFAPTNAAFARAGVNANDVNAVSQVLRYHLINGNALASDELAAARRVRTAHGGEVVVTNNSAGLFVNGYSRIIQSDLVASNGVIHILDEVLAAPAPTPAPTPVVAELRNIVATAAVTPALSTLVSLLTSRGLEPILAMLAGAGEGTYTVFAPSDEAFSRAGIDLTDFDAIEEVLKYHVIKGAALTSGDLLPSQDAQTMQGSGVSVTKNERGVFVNGESRVLTADVAATNGVVHIVDRVLIPTDSEVLGSSIVATAVATRALSTLVSVLTTRGYEPVLNLLSGKGPFTLFAPSNNAFARAGIDPNDVEAVTQLLKYHVINGAAVASGDLQASQSVPTLAGSEVRITKGVNGVRINEDSRVTKADIEATNGIIHIVDTVLMPQVTPSIVEIALDTKALSTLVSVVTRRGYEPILSLLSGSGPFTLFAPSNAAFNRAGINVNDVAAVTEVLKYHVISGAAVTSRSLQPSQAIKTAQGDDIRISKNPNGVFINGGSRVVSADLQGSNGVIHIIDTLLVPPVSSGKSIVATAAEVSDLSTLVMLLTAQGYDGVLSLLSGNGPFTVFAPSNAAFARAGIDVRDVEATARILQYHVLNGVAIASGDLAASQAVQTVMGDKLAITRDSAGTVVLNGEAGLTESDVRTTNGIVHIIDSVLLPPSVGDTRTRINEAIIDGAVTFNTGDVEAAYNIYLSAALAYSPLLDDFTSFELQKSVSAAKAEARDGNFDEGAWELRNGLDFVLVQLAAPSSVTDSTPQAPFTPERASPATVRTEVTEVIIKGAIFYNQGEFLSCYVTYSRGAEEVRSKLSAPARRVLDDAVNSAQGFVLVGLPRYDDACWALRQGLDAVLALYPEA